MILKLLLSDLIKSKKIIFYGMIIPVFLGIIRFMALMISAKGIIEKLTIGDVFYYGFMGIRYSNSLSAVMNLGFWLSINISIIILCSFYIHMSLDSLGLQYLIRCKNKSYWILSKTIFVIFISMEYYLTYIFILCLCGIITKVSFVKYIHIEKILLISGYDKGDIIGYSKSNILKINILVLVILTSICISIIGSLLGYFLINGFNLLIIVTMYLISIFFNSIFLLPIYSCLMRSNIYYINGYNYILGFILNIIIMVIVYVIIHILFLYKNII